jgi:hypothetical protein
LAKLNVSLRMEETLYSIGAQIKMILHKMEINKVRNLKLENLKMEDSQFFIYKKMSLPSSKKLILFKK